MPCGGNFHERVGVVVQRIIMIMDHHCHCCHCYRRSSWVPVAVASRRNVNDPTDVARRHIQEQRRERPRLRSCVAYALWGWAECMAKNDDDENNDYYYCVAMMRMVMVSRRCRRRRRWTTLSSYLSVEEVNRFLEGDFPPRARREE